MSTSYLKKRLNFVKNSSKGTRGTAKLCTSWNLGDSTPAKTVPVREGQLRGSQTSFSCTLDNAVMHSSTNTKVAARVTPMSANKVK